MAGALALSSVRKVERTAAGKYKVRFRGAKRDGTFGQTSETFARHKEASDFAALLDVLGVQGALDHLYEGEQDKAVPTMDELAAAHIESLPNVTEGTRLNYQRLWDRTWSPHIGSTRVHRLDEDQLNAAVRALGKTYSRKSLENQRGLLTGIVARAVKRGYVTENIARGTKLPAGIPSRGKDDMVILTPDQFSEVEERMDPFYRPFIRFLWGTGCRWGEAVVLPVGKVAAPNVSFHQALKWSPDNQRVIGTPKTKKSRRTIAMPPELLEDMERLCRNRHGTDYVFTANRGGMILHRTFWSRHWLPAVEHLEPRPRIHDLRHSHASWLLGRGVPIHVVQNRLGHESIKTTVDTYSHMLPDAQLLASNAAALAFGSPKELG